MLKKKKKKNWNNTKLQGPQADSKKTLSLKKSQSQTAQTWITAENCFNLYVTTKDR